MVRDFSDSQQALPEYDLCIVGSGPAGMVLCGELAETTLRIAVVESGSLEPSAFAGSLRQVVTTGLPIREGSRVRTLGGSSDQWGGLSALLDPIDFEPRSFLNNAARWPLSSTELDLYLRSVAQRYRFPHPDVFVIKNFLDSEEQKESVWDTLEPKVFLASRPPVQFGKEMRNLFRGENIDLLQNLTATEIRCGATGPKTAQTLLGKTHDGLEVVVRARVFVLAAGAIENARLLLNSQQGLAAGLGNEHDQVGRYFMNHPKGYVGRIVLSGDFPTQSHYFSKKRELFSGYVGLRLSEATQRSREALNSYVRLERGFPWTGRSELVEAKAFVRRVRTLLAAPRVQDLAALLRLTPRIIFALPLLLKWGIMRIVRGDRPSVLLPRYFLEMEPRPENRITLGDRKDALGTPLPSVHYTLSSKDTATFELLRDTLRDECARRNIGTYAYNDEVPAEDASHHLGGTRMGHDPVTSVVDVNLKIHTVSNVYVVGGGVFPTSGCANPTMVIAALSARLARHLRETVLPTSLQTSGSAGTVSLLLVGAGARVREDILPAVESLSDFKVGGVFARRPGALFGKRGIYAVKQLSALEPGDVAQANIIYLSIPPQEVAAVLNKLSQYDCLHLTLILPTPVKTPVKAGQFKYVFVEEDSVFLPWLASVRQPLGTVVLNRSAYRYHAIALIKKLCGGEINFGFKLGRSIWLWCNGVRLRLIEPRDYATGTMELLGANGGLQSVPSFAALSLSAEEAELFGRSQEHDTVINRMHDYKRVGLRRLLQSAARGEGWRLADGLDDTRVDTLLHRYGLYSRYF